MIRAYRVALAAGGPLWRTALGLAVLAFVIAVFVPSPDPDARARPEPGSPTANVNTVTLRVPKGELSGTLNIVDASGGELATLTLLSTGETAVAARRGGTGWGLAFTGNGTARMEVVGPVRVTDIEMEPDGTTRISTRERLTGKVPREDDAIGTGQMN